MISQRLVQRTVLRSTHQSSTRLFRNTLQRRFASSGEPPLTGAADNAFNRERRAVKQHAAESSGEWHPFNRLRYGCRLTGSLDLWRKLCI